MHFEHPAHRAAPPKATRTETIHIRPSRAPLSPSAFYTTGIIKFGFFMLKSRNKTNIPPSLQAGMENLRVGEPDVKAKRSWATDAYPTQISADTCPEIG